MYDELFEKVIVEKDPRRALNQFIMRDNATFHKYKEGMDYINERIDQEMLRRQRAHNLPTANRLSTSQLRR